MAPVAFPLVIFDLDGTVIDTLPATYTCFQEAVAPVLGRRPTIDEIRERMGPADQRIIADWVGPEEAEAAVARLYACYEREMAGAGAFPGMRELILDLRRRGARTALFTGRGRPSTERLLDLTGIRDLFETTVTGEEIPRPKPAPDGLLRILERTGFAADRAAYVGDSVMDLRAARDAGVTAVGVLWGSREHEALLAEGDLTADSVPALRRLLIPGSPPSS